jgi:hypothetical protein
MGWNLRGNIKGPKGDQGVQGPAGPEKLRTIVKTAPSATIGIVYVDIPDLAFALEAGKKYRFRYELRFSTAAANTGIGIGLANVATTGNNPFNPAFLAWAQRTQNAAAAYMLGAGLGGGGQLTTTGPGSAIWVAELWGSVALNVAGTLMPQFRSETVGSQVQVLLGTTGTIQEV